MKRHETGLKSLIERIERNNKDQLLELKNLQLFLKNLTQQNQITIGEQILSGFLCHNCNEKKYVVLRYKEDGQLQYVCENCKRTGI